MIYTNRSKPDEIARKVQEHLRRYRTPGSTGSTAFFARVLADQVRPGGGGDFWYVPVAYQQDPNAIYLLFEAFSRIEEELEAESEHVLIVPRLLPPPNEGESVPPSWQ